MPARPFGPWPAALRLGPLVAVMYFIVSGGPFGLEGLVGSVGPALALRLLVATPLLYSVPEALLFAALRRKASERLGSRERPGAHERLDGHGPGLRAENPFRCGAVTFVQRFGGAINLNVHFHSLVLDGVYLDRGAKSPHFVPLPPPDDTDVARVAATVDRKIAKLLARRGLTSDADPEEADPLSRDQPLLAGLYSASVRGRIATGPRTGRRVARLGDRAPVAPARRPGRRRSSSSLPRWNDARRVRAVGLRGQARGAGAATAIQHGPLPRRPRCRSQPALEHRAGRPRPG